MSDLREKLFYEQKNGYDLIDTAERLRLEDYCRDYMAWLNEARTEREAVSSAIALAEERGFVPYVPGMALKAGDKVYQNNRGKALMLAVIGKKPLSEGCVIAGAHVDAPRLDLKQVTMYETDELFQDALLRRHQEVPVGRDPAGAARRRGAQVRRDGGRGHRP